MKNLIKITFLLLITMSMFTFTSCDDEISLDKKYNVTITLTDNDIIKKVIIENNLSKVELLTKYKKDFFIDIIEEYTNNSNPMGLSQFSSDGTLRIFNEKGELDITEWLIYYKTNNNSTTDMCKLLVTEN